VNNQVKSKFQSTSALLKRTYVTKADDNRHAEKPSVMILVYVLLYVTIITFSALPMALP
jgi:hypothetical protein